MSPRHRNTKAEELGPRELAIKQAWNAERACCSDDAYALCQVKDIAATEEFKANCDGMGSGQRNS